MRKKRWMSIMLALCMILTLLPINTAYANEADTQKDANQVEEVQSDEDIVMLTEPAAAEAILDEQNAEETPAPAAEEEPKAPEAPAAQQPAPTGEAAPEQAPDQQPTQQPETEGSKGAEAAPTPEEQPVPPTENNVEDQGQRLRQPEQQPAEGAGPADANSEETEEQPGDSVVTYTITFTDELGTASDETGSEITQAAEGTLVTITAKDRAEEGLLFTAWQAPEGLELADDTEEITTFTMPDSNVELAAEYAPLPEDAEALAEEEEIMLADASGVTTGSGTKSNPYCVSTYADMKRLLQTPASYYIKVVGMNNDSKNEGVPVRRLIAGRDFESKKPAIDIPYGAHHHLEIATDIWFIADRMDGDKNIFGRLIDVESGSSLEVTGTGSIRVEVNTLVATNAIICNWGGELTIDGSVTLNGIQDFTSNVATRPIYINGGITNIKGGYIYGHNNMKATSDDVTSAISFGDTLGKGTALNISGGTIKQVNNSTNQGNENSCALYVDNDTVANAIHLTGGTFEGGMKMKTGKPLSGLLDTGYQFYDMSANAVFNGSVSKTPKKLTVTPTGVNPTVIDKVTLSVKPKAERTKLEDFMYTAYTPYTKLKNPSYQVYEGLNKTGGTQSTEYDASKDYSAIYQFKTESGYVVAESITAADVTLTSGDGQIWKINRYDENTLLVYVNFPSNRVKEVSMTMKSKGDFRTIEDLKCQSFVPTDKLELVNQMFFEGLKDTSNEHQIKNLTAAYQPAADYTGFYVFKLKPDCSFAQDITDLAKKHVTISEGEIYKVDTMTDVTGAHLLRVFVSFEGTGSSISNVHLNFKPVGVRHQIADMSPVNWTPGEGTLGLYNVCYYEGENTDADDKKLNGEVGYDRSKAYSVSFQLVGTTGVVFADGFDANSITLSDGKVWKVQRIDNGNMVICVTFPASGDTATKINAVNLTIKPQEQRKALVDFAPTASTPEGMSVTSTNIYKDGTLYTGSYDANTDYSVGYSLNTKSGYAFANGFKKENVTVSNGTVQSVNVINNNYVIVYVDFPKDPNYVTEAAVQVSAPVVGEKPKGTVDIPVLGDNKDKVKKAMMWWSGMLDGNTAFVAGQEYTAIVYLEPKEGVTFADDMKLNVNGKVVDLLSKDPDGSVQFKVKFTAVDTVTEAAVQVAAPVAGEKPKGTVDIPVLGDNKDKVKKAMMWWSGMLSGNTAFVAGQEYTAIVYLEPKEGVTFADDMKLNVNGKVVDLLSKDPDGSVQFKVMFTATGSTHTHSYGTEWKYDGTNHWHECECGDKADIAAHSASEWIIDTAATETADGAKHKECTVCKKVLETETIPATGSTHTHSYGTDWKYDDTNHWHECECGDKADVAAHNASEWIVDTAATETAEGAKHKECTVCKKVLETATIPATHTHSYGTDWKYDDTNHWHECECGDKVDVAAHSASEWIVDTAATETAEGAKHKECTVCKKVLETATIPATGSTHTHSYGTDWKYDDTNHWHECECRDKADTAAHSFQWVIDKAATKKATGIKHEECTVCGAKRSENTVIAKLSDSGSTGNTGSGNNNTDKPGKDDSTKSPRTGDSSNLIGWLAALFVSGGVLTVLGVRGKKRKESEAE